MTNPRRAEQLYVNANVHTIDRDNPHAEAFAVDADGRLLCVGTRAEAESFVYEGTRVVDLEGKCVLPGFGDDHCHIMPPESVDLFLIHRSDAKMREEFIAELNGRHPECDGRMDYTDCVYAAIMDYAREHPEKDFIVGGGYDPVQLTGEEKRIGLMKYRLDELGENGPAICVYSYTGHDLVANSKCIERSGVSKFTPDPFGGVIGRDEDGEPNGAFHDAAMGLIEVPADIEKQMASIRTFQKTFNAAGVVNVQNVAANDFAPCPMEGAWKMMQDGELTLRMRSTTGYTSRDADTIVERCLADKAKYQSELFAVNTSKNFIDGVFYTLADWPSQPGFHGTCTWEDEEKFKAAVMAQHEAGIQMHFHSYADRSCKMVLDALEEAEAKFPNKDLRHTLAHIMTIRPEDIERMGRYGYVAAMQPAWFVKGTGLEKDYYYGMLGDQWDRQYPFKSFIDAGAIVAGGTDFPVSVEYRPLEGIQVGYTRNSLFASDPDDHEHLLWPEERATLLQTIEAFTINVAREMHCEDTTGNLVAGKYADFVVLSDDIFAVSPTDIHKIQVLKTYLMGREVYSTT